MIVADGTRPAWQPARFDRVIADVPCSGLGALRRRPEARWRRSPADIRAIGALQRGLLRAALDAARPGGVVAYVTCSPHLAETRDVVADVLGERTDVDVLDAPAVLAEVPGPPLRRGRPVCAVLAAPARHRRDLPGSAAAPVGRLSAARGWALGLWRLPGLRCCLGLWCYRPLLSARVRPRPTLPVPMSARLPWL